MLTRQLSQGAACCGMAGKQRNWHGNGCHRHGGMARFLMAFAHGMEVAAVGIGTMETFGAGRDRPLAWPDEDCAVRR